MDVARPFLKSVIEQPVADVDDVLVVGVELTAASELHQLLEVGDVADRALVLHGRALDRARQVVELDQVRLDVEGIGDDALDLEAQHLADLLLPFAHVRLAGGDGHLARGDRHRQDAVALGVGARHRLGHRRKVDLEWIDVVVGQLDLVRQPLREGLEVQQLPRLAWILPFLVGDHHQRMRISASEAAIAGELVGRVLRHQPVRHQVREQLGQLEPAVGLG